ncbi:D-erythronate dehydrogenase [uncultured Roseobacter sp.]|uniref:D-erythronate dehydrogenase n=1 Tax=uncultured Roseobacter sp. TaxID=114847 RepID=UPI0026173827|nr:D-erythronate dehydrogenase [uncultured Roseobacter sp.]
MTRVLIIGGGGMVGQKLLARLLSEGLPGHDTLDISLFDIGFPPSCPEGPAQITGNLTDPAKITQLAGLRPDLIYHLAAIVSGESETDFDKGWATNMMAMWHLLEALRGEHDASGGAYVPRVIFTSSIAVFGAPFPDKIGDEFLCSPQTSYGAQKAISELMLQDFSRKGFMDGMSLRLPTICVRPGKANLAASSFFSGIIREPLNGVEAVLPVPDTVRHWHASPRAAAGFLIHAATLDTDQLEGRRALSLPGLSCTVAEQIEALRRVAGQKAVDLIKPQPDEAIMKIVAGWPRNFDPARAAALGFRAENGFDEIVQTYIAEDLPKASG